MTETAHIVGDGLAGTWFARLLDSRQLDFRCFGNGKTNTPPVAFVHLFQGRTFRRHELELAAFRSCIEFWRGSQFSQEWSVLRKTTPGDRLQRSAHDHNVPEEFAPKPQGNDLFAYRPGFTVRAKDLTKFWRESFGNKFQEQTVEIGDLSGPVVYANGLGIEELLPNLRWDTNPGRTVRARCREHPARKPEHLIIAKGFHLGGNPGEEGFTVGGRVNSKGEAKNDETQLAEEWLKEGVEMCSQWWGERIANALDRFPIIGWLDKKAFVFAGFGGRALFWLPFCAPLAVEAYLEGSNQSLPQSLSIERFRNLL